MARQFTHIRVHKIYIVCWACNDRGRHCGQPRRHGKLTCRMHDDLDDLARAVWHDHEELWQGDYDPRSTYPNAMGIG